MTRRTSSWHEALLYRSREEYVAGVLAFVDAALSAKAPVFISVPAQHGDLLRSALGVRAPAVRFADMGEVGQNPNCIIPVIQEFIDEHAGSRVGFVGEPIWPGRAADEIAEATRHEALINTAFQGSAASVLCPYDVEGLHRSVVADAARTHPQLRADGRTGPSADYADPMEVWNAGSQLTPPPPEAETVEIETTGLDTVRALAREHAEHADLPPGRKDDLVLAVVEVVGNTIRHADGVGQLSMWTEAGSVVCEVIDTGRVRDPLAGRRQPDPDAVDGRGLWLVNQVCDLVQLHSSGAGTSVRFRLSGG